MKLGSIDSIIGLDVPFGTSAINTEIVEIPPIFNPNPKEQARLNYNQESKMKLHKWNKLIADKKSIINIILNQSDEDTRAEIALGSSYEDSFEAGELIKFLARVRTVCNNTDDADVFFGSQVTTITKHHSQPTSIVEELLSAYPTDDAIWNNTNPCHVSFGTADGTEIATSIDVTKESTVTTILSMSNKDDTPWFDTNEEFDSWYNTTETKDDYREWDDPPNVPKSTSIINKSLNKHIESDFCFGERQT